MIPVAKVVKLLRITKFFKRKITILLLFNCYFYFSSFFRCFFLLYLYIMLDISKKCLPLWHNPMKNGNKEKKEV